MTNYYRNAKGEKVVRFDNLSMHDRKRLFNLIAKEVAVREPVKVWQSPENDHVDRFLVAINR